MENIYGYIRINPDERLVGYKNQPFRKDHLFNFEPNFSDEQKFLLEEKCKKFVSQRKMEERELYLEVYSGDTFDRPVWKKLKEKLKENDIVVVMTLKDFSTCTFRTTLKEIESLRERKINFSVLDLKFDKEDKDKNLFDYVADIYDYFEAIRLDRQGTALAMIAANPILRKEKYPGRKTILEPNFFQKLQELLQKNITSPSILARELGTSRSTIYKALKLLKEENTIADGET